MSVMSSRKLAKLFFSTRPYSATLKNVNESKIVYGKMTLHYDKMIQIATFGRRPLWLRELVSQISVAKNTRLLDMAGGQGAISLEFLNRVRRLGVAGCISSVCDISEEMLAYGKEKAQKLGHGDDAIRWVQGDIHQVPFDDAFFDACFLCSGIRKIDLELVLSEARRVLKPGGRFFVFDTARPKNPMVDWLYWDFHISHVVPYLTKMSLEERSNYLTAMNHAKSVPLKDEMTAFLKAASFEEIESGQYALGIMAYYICRKTRSSS